MSEAFVIDLDYAQSKGQYFSKKIAWPVYAWKAILPKSMTGEIDILQKLILSLAQINMLKGSSILNELGISKELLLAVRESCIQSNYLTPDGTLTSDGRKILSHTSTIEQSMLAHYEQVYIFRDALTGDIIPHFTMKELPRAFRTNCDIVFKENKNQQKKKPIFTEIEMALQVSKNIRRIIEDNQKEYGVEEVIIEAPVDQDLLAYLDEVDWRDINDDGEVVWPSEEDVKTVSAPSLQADTSVKIMDESPTLIYFGATLYIDADVPDRLNMTSPFGGAEGSWFSNHLLMHKKKDEEVKTLLDIFEEQAREYLKHRYPFNNDYQIPLLYTYPIIANDAKWRSLREEMEAMQNSFNRIANGDEDYDTFYMRAQRTLECILKLSLQTIPDKLDTLRLVSVYNFKDTIMRIQEELQIAIPKNLHNKEFFGRLLAVARDKGISSKDRALFLAFDAFFNENSQSLQVFRDVPDFYERINRIVNIRNQSTHFSENKPAQLTDYQQIKDEADRLLEVLIAKYLVSRGE